MPFSSASSERGLHPGQRHPDRTRASLARQGVGQGEQRLGHAVALQHVHAVAGQLVPQIGRQRRRPRHAQAQRAESRRLSRRGEAVVHGGHAEEHGVRPERPRGPPPRRSGRTRWRRRRRPGCRTTRRTTRGRGTAASRARGGPRASSPTPSAAPRRRPGGRRGCARPPSACPWSPRCRRSARRRPAAEPGRRRARCGRRRRPARRRRGGPARHGTHPAARGRRWPARDGHRRRRGRSRTRWPTG